METLNARGVAVAEMRMLVGQISDKFVFEREPIRDELVHRQRIPHLRQLSKVVLVLNIRRRRVQQVPMLCESLPGFFRFEMLSTVLLDIFVNMPPTQ